jgi:hypothetical protein
MITIVMVMFLIGLTVLLTGGSVKAARMQTSSIRHPRVIDYCECLTSEDCISLAAGGSPAAARVRTHRE